MLKLNNKAKKSAFLIFLILAISGVIYHNQNLIREKFTPASPIIDNPLLEEPIISEAQETPNEELPPLLSNEEPAVSLPATLEDKESVNYHADVSKLVAYFLQDKEFGYQISELKKLKLPADVQKLVLLFDEYNSKYLTKEVVLKEKIQLFNFSFLERFIKVEKASPVAKEKELLRKEIIKNLDYFIDFFSSDELSVSSRATIRHCEERLRDVAVQKIIKTGLPRLSPRNDEKAGLPRFARNDEKST